MKCKKKILFINGHLNAGGCERSLVDVLRHFDYSKYDVDLLLLEEKGDYAEEIPEDVNIRLISIDNAHGPIKNVLVTAIKNRDWFSIKFRLIIIGVSIGGCKYYRFARKIFKNIENNYDVIIAYRPGICTDLAAYTFKAKNKISWWHHGEMALNSNDIYRTKDAYKLMNHIVAVSESSATIVRDTFPEVVNRITVIPNMICVEEVRNKADMYNLEFDSDNINIVSVGRMSHEKNMLLCPRVGMELKKRGIKYKWYLIGDGEEYNLIKSMIEQNNLTEFFELTGRVSNPYPYIKGATVMVHPSLVESQGITILEGMALETPVIAVKSAGPQEYMKNGFNGFLVEPDCNMIADKIENIKLIQDNIMMNGLMTAKSYDVCNIEKMIEELIDSI